MSSLAKHLYSRANGRVQTDLTNINAASGTYAACATPPSGKKLAIMKIVLAPTTVGTDDSAVSFAIYDSGDALLKTVFDALKFTVSFPLSIDLRSCPIIMSADDYLAVRSADTVDDQESNITVHSFVLEG